MLKQLAAVTILLFNALFLRAGKPDEENSRLFLSANNNLIKGNYGPALKDYQKIERNGYKAAGLYTNMGDLFFKTNRRGMALLYFEKGIRLSPLDTQLVYNRNKVLAKFDKSITANNSGFDSENALIFNLVEIFSKVAIAALLFSGLLVIVVSFSIKMSSGLIIVKICKILAFASLILITVIWLSFKGYQSKQQAVIVKPTAPVYLGPATFAKVDLYFSEGYMVEIINTYKDWYEIKDYHHRSGWVKSNDLIKIE